MNNELPAEILAMFDLLKREAAHTSNEELNQLMAKRVRDYNTRPQTELGGLSPDAMYQLLYGDWVSEGALRLNEKLTHEELAGAAILADARVLLEYFRDEGPVKETAAHFLPRAVVAAMHPRLRMHAQPHIFHDRPPRGQLKEGDVRWLPDLRYLLIFGGLLVRRKGLRITPLGRAILSPEREGELYALLFRTLFRKFDLRVLGSGDDHAGLQGTVAYSFYRLRAVARNWTSSQLLARTAWLESAKDPLSESEIEGRYDFRYIAFRLRVLDPLVQCGLLESRLARGEDPLDRDIEYRCAPLFDRFLKFKFTSV
jgi:hypothetical protein